MSVLPKHDIVVVGTSAGGLQALRTLVRNLDDSLSAAVFIVMHVSPDYVSLLPQILGKTTRLHCAHAVNHEPIRSGRIYVATPDHHMVVETDHVRLTKGPKENRSRPAVDALFRSAAYVYGSRVIGIVLTGNLDDGTAGLWAIKDRGGIAMVQDPKEAQHPSMPLNAMQHVDIDFCLSIDRIAETLAKLTSEDVAVEELPMSKKLEIETKIALEHNPLESGVLNLGDPTLFTCPSCHGTLIGMKDGNVHRFRCHTGHAFSIQSLLAELNESSENYLWSAVRAFDEKLFLLKHLERHAREANHLKTAAYVSREVEESKRQQALLRDVALKARIPVIDPSETESI